ncbi:MAG: DUF1553 domain-containing protein [Acidobacteria bacterium]|nr:DUF1553 domain-containing protein [Acidobacteriota bacterium]
MSGPRALPLLLAALWLVPTVPAEVDFQRQVQPILKKCLPCHGRDEHARQANLRLDSFEHATGKSGGHPGIAPGDAAHSRIVARVQDDKNPMPPGGERLSAAEIDVLKQWIDGGAKYQQHWAFEAPARPEPPTVSQPDWVRNPIDAFVLARLDKAHLKPSVEADRYTLARRLALDLTGLPPEPELVKAFVEDESPEAYEKVVDRLLNSPHYGERWARVWLDLARYADSQGYEKDGLRTIWPYRDWVIRALNANMPFDRFTVLQLAGDLLPVPTEDQLVATGFHRNTMTNTEGGTDDEEFRDAAVKDRVATTGQVWMGLTVGCAQCHSHKYDPISHQEFYQLYAFFNQTADADKPNDEPKLEVSDDVTTLIFRELPADERRETHIHERGSFLSPGALVEPATPAAFEPFPEEFPRNRLGLAKWLVSKRNPLTARVLVNRLWSRLWGIGIVETEEDFGTQGLPPSHPELLDWLATELMRLDWDMKGVLKTMVMSATYRQSSDVTAAMVESDPKNRLLARGARFRLSAEMVRDQALAASGLLNEELYGEPVMPWQPDGIWQVIYSPIRWTTSEGDERYRRSLYTLWRRTSPYPAMTTFDAPSGEVCTVRRISTNTPLQALVTLNDPTLMEAAQRLALAVADDDRERTARTMFERALVRPPTEAEVERVLALQAEARAELAGDRERALELVNFDRVLYTDERTATLVADVREAEEGRGPAAMWRYTTEDPGADWMQPRFKDSKWEKGRSAFGRMFRKESDKEDPNEKLSIATPWESDNLWLRTEIDVDEKELTDFRLYVRAFAHFEAFVNGVAAADSVQETGTHVDYKLTPQAAATVRPGKNVLAVRVFRSRPPESGQHVDIGLTAVRPPRLEAQGGDEVERAAWVVAANVLLNLDETLTRR